MISAMVTTLWRTLLKIIDEIHNLPSDSFWAHCGQASNSLLQPGQVGLSALQTHQLDALIYSFALSLSLLSTPSPTASMQEGPLRLPICVISERVLANI